MTLTLAQVVYLFGLIVNFNHTVRRYPDDHRHQPGPAFLRLLHEPRATQFMRKDTHTYTYAPRYTKQTGVTICIYFTKTSEDEFNKTTTELPKAPASVSCIGKNH